MIPYSDRPDIGGLGARSGVGFPHGRISGCRRREQVVFRSKLYNNKRQNLDFGVVTIRGWNITTS